LLEVIFFNHRKHETHRKKSLKLELGFEVFQSE